MYSICLFLQTSSKFMSCSGGKNRRQPAGQICHPLYTLTRTHIRYHIKPIIADCNYEIMESVVFMCCVTVSIRAYCLWSRRGNPSMSFMASPRVIGLALLSLLVAPRTTARVIPSMSSDTATPSAPSSAFLSPLRVQIVSARRKERNPNPRSESARYEHSLDPNSGESAQKSQQHKFSSLFYSQN